MPAGIVAAQPHGSEWIIELAGRAKYKFSLANKNRIVPDENLTRIKMISRTPNIIAAYALDDEQALLAKARCNRLIDISRSLSAMSAWKNAAAIA